jgi:hypothetical protein
MLDITLLDNSVVEKVVPGDCRVSSQRPDGATVLCDVAITKRSNSAAPLPIEWTYTERYSQVITLKSAVGAWTWTPDSPSPIPGSLTERVKVQAQINAALSRWVSDLESGDPARVRLASLTHVDGSLKATTCAVAMSVPRTTANCSFKAAPNIRTPEAAVFVELLGVTHQQQLALEQLSDGSWSVTPTK